MATRRNSPQRLRKRDTTVKKTQRGATHEPSGVSKQYRKVLKHLGIWQQYRNALIDQAYVDSVAKEAAEALK